MDHCHITGVSLSHYRGGTATLQGGTATLQRDHCHITGGSLPHYKKGMPLAGTALRRSASPLAAPSVGLSPPPLLVLALRGLVLPNLRGSNLLIKLLKVHRVVPTPPFRLALEWVEPKISFQLHPPPIPRFSHQNHKTGSETHVRTHTPTLYTRESPYRAARQSWHTHILNHPAQYSGWLEVRGSVLGCRGAGMQGCRGPG